MEHIAMILNLLVRILKNAINKYNSQKAKQYLEKGTGILSDELIYYKDENLECKANDVLATIDIKIKNEIAKSYEKALDFIINLFKIMVSHIVI